MLAPPPSSDAKPVTWKTWFWPVLLIAALIVGVSSQMRKQSVLNARTGQRGTVNNARQIGLAIFEFDTEYGRFPDETTIAKVREDTGTDLQLGAKSSNDFFRQLLASKIAGSESMFYAPIAGTRRPDNDFAGRKALEKGEVGFAYFAGLSSKGDPMRPVVIAPLIPGTDRFDPKPFMGKVVVFRLDNSVTSMNIGKDGRVMWKGQNLLDPAHPVWGGEKWKLVSPDL